jgi:predicted kinase
MSDATRTSPPRVVLLVGEPGSGKTQLGLALSAELGVPFLARDQVRRGMYATAGAWSDAPGPVPTAEEAVDAFLSVVETMTVNGISCVVEYVVRRSRPQDLERITTVADCVVVQTWCDDAPARRARRDAVDPLLLRPEVLGSLGLASSDEAEAARAERMRRVTEEMQHDFSLPVLRVDTNAGLDPPLAQILLFAIGT